jgi:uncharacterized membrane protein
MMRSLGGGRAASRRRSLLVAALLTGSALLVLGVAVRVALVHSLDGTNLVWNLFLAWIPFVLALVLYDGARHRASPGTLVALGAAWLLFLPNAPYIVTDVKWLGEYAGGRLWFDAALIGTAAAIGLVLGFVSLYLVQVVVAGRFGHVAGWALAWTALALSGVGVYLGRFQRWNSWDVVTEPTTTLGQLARAALDPLAYTRPLALSVAFAVTWCVGYALFYSTFQSHLRRLADG